MSTLTSSHRERNPNLMFAVMSRLTEVTKGYKLWYFISIPLCFATICSDKNDRSGEITIPIVVACLLRNTNCFLPDMVSRYPSEWTPQGFLQSTLSAWAWMTLLLGCSLYRETRHHVWQSTSGISQNPKNPKWYANSFVAVIFVPMFCLFSRPEGLQNPQFDVFRACPEGNALVKTSNLASSRDHERLEYSYLVVALILNRTSGLTPGAYTGASPMATGPRWVQGMRRIVWMERRWWFNWVYMRFIHHSSMGWRL